MTHKELVDQLEQGTKITVKGTLYTVKQHIVWMQHRAGYPYDKWVLVDADGYDGYRLFIEVTKSAMGFGKIFRHDFVEPLPETLEFEGKKYKRTWDEFCTVKQAEGEEIYKEGEGEVWWDYVAEDNNQECLSLGRSWETWEREDLKTLSLELEDVQIVER